MSTRKLFVATALFAIAAPCALAQPAEISWRVENRFRLFRHQADFDRHVAAHRDAAGNWRSILDVERLLAAQTDGHGWARPLAPGKTGRLCFALAGKGRYPAECRRFGGEEAAKGIGENYVNPVSHRVSVAAKLPAGREGARCVWTFEAPGKTSRVEADCARRVEQRIAAKIDLAGGKRVPAPTLVKLVVSHPGFADLTASAAIAVRDVAILGLGDSIASGEGNPERPVGLVDKAFCYRRLLGNGVFYAPSRLFGGGFERLCEAASPGPTPAAQVKAWESRRAGWMSSDCHRSVYGHQLRAALALAARHEHLSVTYLGFGCTGATIREGLRGGQRARDLVLSNGSMKNGMVESQRTQIKSHFIAGGRRVRPVDAILLTIGANDIGFAALVADVIVDPETRERKLAENAGLVTDVPKARKAIEAELRPQFAKLRAMLAPWRADGAGKVIFTLYGNPAPRDSATSCAQTRRGFDVHPALRLDTARAGATAAFVDDEFVPALRALAGCEAGGGCAKPAHDAMAVVDAHRADFARHGLCAAAASDPEFDRACFRDGTSFFKAPGSDQSALDCGAHGVSDFRPYAARARWIRTGNDSYFAAMTFPASLRLKPANLHDGLWGVAAALYGGAIHPTAEGHARMADAVLPELEKALGLAP